MRGIPVSPAFRSWYSSIMKIAFSFMITALVALAAAGCREEARLTVLFSGDERGFVAPAG